MLMIWTSSKRSFKNITRTRQFKVQMQSSERSSLDRHRVSSYRTFYQSRDSVSILFISHNSSNNHDHLSFSNRLIQVSHSWAIFHDNSQSETHRFVIEKRTIRDFRSHCVRVSIYRDDQASSEIMNQKSNRNFLRACLDRVDEKTMTWSEIKRD